MPGNDYPVFQTGFGKLGILICYDLFFPEVSRELAKRGAEIIAAPIWDGDGTLARTRALDDCVFLVTSRYEQSWMRWMRSGVWDREGNLIAAAKRNGTLVFAEVDLNDRFEHKWATSETIFPARRRSRTKPARRSDIGINRAAKSVRRRLSAAEWRYP